MKQFSFSLLLLMVLIWGMSAQAEEPGSDGQEITIEEFLQKLSTIPDVVGRKDPFVAAGPPFEIPKKEDENAISMSAPVLERYPILQYTVVATLLGDEYPRALLKLPAAEKGKVLIVKLKDKLGNKGGVISKILKDGIVVLQSNRSPLGFVEKTEVVLRVGTDAAVPPPPGVRAPPFP